MGADTRTLLTITRALIYSIIDYGSATYTATNNQKIKKLETAQNKALRISTYALPNTKTEELYRQTGHPTIKERRDKQILKQWANRSQHGNNLPTNIHLRNKSWDKIGFRGKNAKKKNSNRWTENKLPPYQLTKRLLEKHKLNTIKIEKPNAKSQPPCTIIPPQIDLTLLKQPKKYSNPPVAKQKALEHINKTYSNHYHIYTDGSKNEIGTGAAAHTHTCTYTYKLDKNHSILTAELIAIRQALAITNSTTITQTQLLILTDSLTSLQNLANPFQSSRTKITNQILKHIKELEKKGIHTTLLWIPSHTNIVGNETADRGAKYGSRQGKPLTTSIHTSEIQSQIRAIYTRTPTPNSQT